MSHWKEYKLGEIGKIITGTTPPTKNPENYGNFLLFVTPTDFDAYNKTINNSIRSISEIAVNKFKNRIIPKDSVIVTCIGSQMGKVAINKKACLTNQQINSIIPNKEFDSDFIYYTLKSMQDYLRNLATGGSTMPIINKSSFENITITVPPLPTQTAIASILSSLDQKIELNNAINRNLEALAQALFKQWFVEFEFPVDQNGNFSPLTGEMSQGQRGYKSSGGEMVESELGMIPKGWRVRKLNEVIEVKYGKDHKHLEDGDIPVYGSGGIMRYANKSLYCNQSILIPRKGTLSNMFLINEPFWSVDTMFYTIIKIDFYAKYLFYTLKSFDLASMNVGSAVPSMTTKVLNDLSIILPSDNIIKRFDEAVNPIFDNKDAVIKENHSISILRDTLLPKLISGELEVKDV